MRVLECSALAAHIVAESILRDARRVKIARNGNRELTAQIVEETWICLCLNGKGEVLRVSLVEATELVDLLRGQIGLLAFGMGRTRRIAKSATADRVGAAGSSGG